MKRFVFPILALLGFACYSSPYHSEVNSDVGGSEISSVVSSSSSNTSSSSTSSSNSSSGASNQCFVNPATDNGMVAPCPGTFDMGEEIDNPVFYLGGPIMASPITYYYIWYGEWATRTTTQPVLEYLAQNLPTSSLYGIDKEYYQSAGIPDDGSILDAGIDGSDAGTLTYLSNTITFGGSVFVSSNVWGTYLSDDNLISIINDTLTTNQIPTDTNAQYFLLTSPEVQIYDEASGTGFCTSYCGFHDHATINGADIKYALVGDGLQCPTDCTPQANYLQYGFQHSPNNDWSADMMASVLIHESSEMATDPNPETNGAWQSTLGYEMADLCAWVYGDLYLTTNGSVANVKVGGKDFLIQKLWDLNSENCSLKP